MSQAKGGGRSISLPVNSLQTAIAAVAYTSAKQIRTLDGDYK
jgi:hypothetical protein